MAPSHLRLSLMHPKNNPTATNLTPRSDSQPPTYHAPPANLLMPFGYLEGLDQDDYREAAYEVFFTACRSSPGFGGRGNNHSDGGDDIGSGPGSPVLKPHGVGMAVTSRVKMALGLKMLRRSPSRRISLSSGIINPGSPSGNNSPRTPSFGARLQRRPLTSAEIMRHQMRVTEPSDNRLRKTLMRTLVGQMGRRAETIILPLELLRHLKPSEFNDHHEYHIWQKRQLKILETGLLLHPLVPLEKSNKDATKFRELILACETKAIDPGKNSESMKSLVNSIVSLAWRSPDGGSTDVCHWADGYPLNLYIYNALLGSVFDLKDETLVLDEIDELFELMKKTWLTLGINRSIHNLCFTWVLFEQYVATGQVAPDLLGASLAMLNEVAIDAKKADREPIYVKMLACVLATIKKWCEKRLLDYHSKFDKGNATLLENMVPLVVFATKILEEDVPCYVAADQERGEAVEISTGNRAEHYIRSSLRTAFAKMLENQNVKITTNTEAAEAGEVMIRLAQETEELALNERARFSSVLKKWHPMSAGVAAVTLHTCYGTLLKQYLTGTPTVMNETILVLQRAGKLEKSLLQIVVEDCAGFEDGGKSVLREMVLYDVESLMLKLFRQWIQERMKKGKENLQKLKESETWNPNSKTEPYAYSAMELIRFGKEAIDHFFDIPVNVSENLVYELTDGLEHLFRDYITFISACGSKQSYLPVLPPLTRCSSSRESRFFKLWKIAACNVGLEDPTSLSNEGNNPRPSTSRGTQRLYIRLNTLHYLLSQLQSLDKTMSLNPKITPAPKTRFGNRRQYGSSYFEHSKSTILSACQHVSEVAAYRLIFLDSNSVFYGSLYVGDVANARIRPALRRLKQNLTLLCALLTDKAQPLALKEVMKASFDAFLMVLLAGGNSRIFHRSDHPMIEEDFENLKRVFCMCGEGLIVEDIADKEAEAVHGIVALMGQTTEQLIEDFSTVACEASRIGVVGTGHKKLPMPPTTGKWNRTDPNTILRVLCSRKDRVANHFLKKTFQLAPKKTGSR